MLTLEKSDGTTGHEQSCGHWENLDEIPVLAQHFTEIVIRLAPTEVNGLFDIAIDSL